MSQVSIFIFQGSTADRNVETHRPSFILSLRNQRDLYCRSANPASLFFHCLPALPRFRLESRYILESCDGHAWHSPSSSLSTLFHLCKEPYPFACSEVGRASLMLTFRLTRIRRTPFTIKTRAMATPSASLVDFGKQHVTNGLGRLTEDVFEKGTGSWVTMKSGRRILDFTCGIGVTNLGASLCLLLIFGEWQSELGMSRSLPPKGQQGGSGPMHESRARPGTYPLTPMTPRIMLISRAT